MLEFIPNDMCQTNILKNGQTQRPHRYLSRLLLSISGFSDPLTLLALLETYKIDYGRLGWIVN